MANREKTSLLFSSPLFSMVVLSALAFLDARRCLVAIKKFGSKKQVELSRSAVA